MNARAAAFEKWSNRLPARLWARSPLLATLWADGAVLSRWPRAMLVATALTFLFGFCEGAFHFSFYTLGDGAITSAPALVFMQIMPLVLVIAALGAFDLRLGLILLLGFMLGEQVVAGTSFINPREMHGLWWNFGHIRVPQFMAYLLFALLALLPRLLMLLLTRAFDELPRLFYLLGLIPLVLVVCAWALAAPMIVRPVWLWSFYNSSAIIVPYYIDVMLPWLPLAAALGALLRLGLEEWASRDIIFVGRMLALEEDLMAAQAQPPKQRLPVWIRIILVAGFVTLMSAGFIWSFWPTGLVMFSALGGLLVVNRFVLPRWPRWVWLAENIQRIPLLLRGLVLIAGCYGLAWLVLAMPGFAVRVSHATGAFAPQLTTLVLGFALALFLFPEWSVTATNTTNAQPPSPGQTRGSSAGLFLLISLWPALAFCECAAPGCCFVNNYWAAIAITAVLVLMLLALFFFLPETLWLLRSFKPLVRFGLRFSKLLRRQLNIPKNWKIVASRKNGGIKFVDPKDSGSYVRVMPGDKSSIYQNPKNVYVRWQKNGRSFDVRGQPSGDREAIHIPLKDFIFNRSVFK